MKNWYVLYVNSRAEKKVAERLQEKGWEVFCPLKTEWRQWSDRKKRVSVPYFRSYVFVRFSLEEKAILLQIQGVVRILFWMGKPAVIRDNEMQEVQHFFTRFGGEDIVREQLKEGASYRVKQGVMEGKSGIVLWQNADRAMLEIPELNMRFSVRKAFLKPNNRQMDNTFLTK